MAKLIRKSGSMSDGRHKRTGGACKKKKNDKRKRKHKNNQNQKKREGNKNR